MGVPKLKKTFSINYGVLHIPEYQADHLLSQPMETISGILVSLKSKILGHSDDARRYGVSFDTVMRTD